MENEANSFNPGALELGQAAKVGYDVLLLGSPGLSEVDPELRKYPTPLPEEAAFKYVVGVGHRCYYIIQAFLKDEIILHERGVGTVLEKSDQTVLQRDIPIAWGDAPDENKPALQDGNPVRIPACDFIRVQTITPPTYLEALAFPYTVIACVNPFIPTPVEVEENSLLGRIGDIIQSVDMDELKEMLSFDESALNSIIKQQKQIKFKTRRIDMDRKNAVISSPIVRVSPDYTTDTRPDVQKGSIIFNNETESLEYFDGMKWRTLVFKED